MSKPSVIAIDGPAAAGKTTLAQHLAVRMGYLYFDTGVIYRAVTLAALRQGVDVYDADQVSAIARAITIDVAPPTVDDGRPATIYVDGEDVTWNLREAIVDQHVSIPSAMQGVREAVLGSQRRIAERGGVVLVGRDIGTVVVPDADLKLYLKATVEARARRRLEDYRANGQQVSYDEVLNAMRRRDELDSHRELAPMRPAEDAVIIDTTEMDVMGLVTYVEEIIEQCDSATAGDQ